MLNFSVSIIIPALNEEEILPRVFFDTLALAKSKFTDFEIILINDGSIDSTLQVMNSCRQNDPRISVIDNAKNLGFGASYRLGVSQAKGDYIILLCGDGGLPITSLEKLIPYIGSVDIVIPWMKNLKIIKSNGRYLLSRTYTRLLNLFFNLDLHYYNGLSIHKASLIKGLIYSDSGFGFQAEILIKLIRSGATYVQVGVEGAEEAQQSDALNIKNWFRIFSTISALLASIPKSKITKK
jgi:dolichol-phosphate mannosyltransferase